MDYHPSLDYFCAIVEKKTITRAAEYLNITQQALSSYLKRLEDYYEVLLFTRMLNLELTPFGRELYIAGCKIRSIHAEINNILPRYSNKMVIRLGLPNSLTGIVNKYILDIQSYQSVIKGVQILFMEGINDVLFNAVENNSLDMTVLTHEPENYNGIFHVIRKGRYNVIFHQALLASYAEERCNELVEKFKRNRGVCINDLADIPYLSKPPKGHMHKILDEYAENNQFKFWRICESGNQEMNLQMCKDGVGFFIGSYYDALSFKGAPNMMVFKILEPELDYIIGVYVKEKTLKIPHIKTFWDKAIQKI
jgi:DNA-binding transcriptional LysR family regulator